MKIETKEKLQKRHDSILVYDLETCSSYPNGEPINIKEDFDSYITYAKAKWIGFYSYKYKEYKRFIIDDDTKEEIRAYIQEHDILCGFNNIEFDNPILFNNGLMPEGKYYMDIDCLQILGETNFYNHSGLPFKGRAKYMGFKAKNNSLRAMAEAMELETQKGEIDYNIFFKDSWTAEEIEEIEKYLEADVMATKQMLDKMWEYWYPFTQWLYDEHVLDLSWIRSSMASLRYKCDCKTLGVEVTYADKPEGQEKEEMGGNVYEPKYEEAWNVWYIDYASFYPHADVMFGLYNEMRKSSEWLNKEAEYWHGNELFEVKGYYDISEEHPIALDVREKLKLKETLSKDDPMRQCVKVFLNAGYGALRSPIFEQIHKPNAGWDTCWLCQQMQAYTEKRMNDFGFETIAGDTDSLFVVAKDKDRKVTKEEMTNYLKQITEEIQQHVPFPCETFKIDIEDFIPYIMWPFKEQPIVGPDGKNLKNEKGRLIKERRGLKKNYVYLYEKDGELSIDIKGLAIIKDNSTELGKKILEETLKPMILTSKRAKFSRQQINNIIEIDLKNPENLKLLACEYKVKPSDTYKKENQIQAQISRGYFNGQDGVISLIKNKKIGKAGKTAKYCTPEEAEEAGLELKDIDLTKIGNELEPFVRHEE